MIVCKFGGTSVGDRAAQRRLVDIVRTRLDEAPLVVVSALSGVSDALIAILETTLAGRDREGKKALTALADRHRALLEETLPLAPAGDGAEQREGVSAVLEAQLAELEALRKGIALLDDASPWIRARFVGAGELLSSQLVRAAFLAEGIAVEWVDARAIVRTEGTSPEKDPPLTAEILTLAAPLLDKLGTGRVVLTQGFIGSDARGKPTLLGRGGSDYSASLFGAALGARRIEIWTDVDGVLTANPKLIRDARRVRRLSFGEASELAYFGAKVLHPATILPAMEQGIPVAVLNAKRPEGEGTTILASVGAPTEDRWVVKAIADKRGIALVHITSTRMLMAHGFLARIFAVFEAARTPVDLLASSEVTVSLTIDDTSRLTEIREGLERFAHVEVEEKLAVVCLVGEGMRGRPGVAAEVFRAIPFARPRLITQGASAINLSLVVGQDEADGVVLALHEVFFRGSLPAEWFGEPVHELGPVAPAPVRMPDLVGLARKHGTPCYVYDLGMVRERVLALQAALPDPRCRLFYAMKANPHPAILGLMRELGVSIEAASPGEAARALEAGHAAARILMSATNAHVRDIAAASAAGHAVTVGSRSHLRALGPLVPGAEVLLRVNPGVGAGHHAHVVTGGQHSKFGIPVSELEVALDEAHEAGLRVVGLHAHAGSGILDATTLVQNAARVVEIARGIAPLSARARGGPMRVLDIGGGLGVPYRDDDPELDLARWSEGLKPVLAECSAEEIWIEPGRYCVAPAGWLLAEVTCRKDSEGLRFIGLNTGMNHLLRPALYGAYHRILNLSAPDNATEWVEVVGNVCETTDLFASNRAMPRLEEGHLVAFRDVGAYGYSMASDYNLWPRPSEVIVGA